MNMERQYLNAVQDVLTTGTYAENRTGTPTLFKHGLYMTQDLQEGFPLLTTKRMNWKSIFAEMLGFWRGYDNAADFRKLGTKVWDANANKNEQWLNNPARKGEDDIGRVYGKQARDWHFIKPHGMGVYEDRRVDQLCKVYADLEAGIDNRREIVTHWNPGELDQMALPPCHLLYQFGLREDYLDLFVYIRSNDLGLGAPFNMAGYAWLLCVMAHITGKKKGVLHYFAWNYHIYVNHINPLRRQLKQEITTKVTPSLRISPCVDSLDYMDKEATVADFVIGNYQTELYPLIPMPMAV